MSFIVPMENSEIDRRFSTEHRMTYEPHKDPDEEFVLNVEKVSEKLKLIPPKEADMISLYYMYKKDQADIGKIFGLTQGDVSYRLARAVERLQYLLELPEVDKAQMIEDLRPYMPDTTYLEIMIGMWKTTSQSVVARQLNTTQGRVRYRFVRGIEILKNNLQLNKDLDVYVRLFDMVASNYNILHELSGSAEESKGSFLTA